MITLIRGFSGFILLISIFAFPAFAQNADAAAKLAEEFFETYPSKDFEKITTFWSEKSPERDRFLKIFRFSLAANRKRNLKFVPLPEAEREIAKIASFYQKDQSRLFTGTKASEGVFKSQAEKFRVLHFATHGVADNENPMYSFLVFSQAKGEKDDGILEAWEVMQMKLRADIAVLSACETGRGKVGEGEGIVGLSWAFFVAGVPTTVVSQWKVESGKTADLMVEFHRNLGQNTSKSKALQNAMISMLKTKTASHPFYWAGFVLVGKN